MCGVLRKSSSKKYFDRQFEIGTIFKIPWLAKKCNIMNKCMICVAQSIAFVSLQNSAAFDLPDTPLMAILHSYLIAVYDHNYKQV